MAEVPRSAKWPAFAGGSPPGDRSNQAPPGQLVVAPGSAGAADPLVAGRPPAAARETTPTPAGASASASGPLAPPRAVRPDRPVPAVEDIYRAELARVRRALVRLGVPSRHAPDLAQEVFVVIHRCLRSYDPDRPLRPWIAGIVRRVASSHRRKAHRRNEVLCPSSEPIGPVPNASGNARFSDPRAWMVDLLGKIAASRRVVLLLHDVAGYTMPELCRILGIPLNTGYSRLRRGRRDLRVALVEMDAEPTR